MSNKITKEQHELELEKLETKMMKQIVYLKEQIIKLYNGQIEILKIVNK
tara:strand:+ start:464 stop:610 length:147 start_codon:yes stop_codon:yes gene_type:complete